MSGLVLALAFVAPVSAQVPTISGAGDAASRATTRSALAVRAIASPVLDGSDADGIWATTPLITGFRQFDPSEDADATFSTEFRVAYDDDALFVFVRAYDPSPDSILHALSRRDVRGPSDQLKIIIDAYHDRRTGFEFAVNPDGVKRDFAMYNDGGEDGSWNGIWDVAVAVDSLGWTAEFRIPFSQLRFAPRDVHTFGFGVWRDIERLKERDSWPLFRPSRSGVVSQLGEIGGISGIGSLRRLEVTPYVLARNSTRPARGGFERAQEQEFGADLRYGITPNVSLTATVNPDFGQVEADPSTVNLTAFETFFPEQRPFFVEGTGLYRFELNCYIVQDCGNEGLFYSRRIGRAPQLAGRYGDASSPIATPILAASKLTGRSQGGFSFGVLDAFTRRETGPGERTIEPATNYAVVRAKQDFRGGESDVSLIATAVNRSLDEWSEDVLRRNAYTVGASARHRFGGGNYQVKGSFIASRVDGTQEAIALTQRDNVHAFQRPDGPDRYDPLRTSLSGTSQELIVGKYGGGVTRFETAFERQSAGFEPNDLGYLQRADQMRWATWGSLQFREPNAVFRSLQINANQWNHWTTDGTRLETSVNANAHMWLMPTAWWVHAGGTLGGLGGPVCDRCSRGGPAVRRSTGFHPWLGINGDSRRVLNPNLWMNLSFADEGNSHRINLSPSLSARFSTRLTVTAGMSGTHNVDDAQWYGNFGEEDGTTRYVFANLDQRTVSLNARIAYALTPDLTFDLYAQPFTSAGTWSDFRALSETPQAASYDDRYRPYAPDSPSAGFEFRQMRSNAVVRWEFRPGSTLYLVWSHARDGSLEARDERSWQSEFGELFDMHPDNTFLIKLSYWFNR